MNTYKVTQPSCGENNTITVKADVVRVGEDYIEFYINGGCDKPNELIACFSKEHSFCKVSVEKITAKDIFDDEFFKEKKEEKKQRSSR